MRKVGVYLLMFLLLSSFAMPVFADSAEPNIHYEAKEVRDLPESKMLVPKITKISDDADILKKTRDQSLFLPFGPGEWDYLGSSMFKTKSKTFYSGGGDLRIYIGIPKSGSAKWLFKLYEEDPGWNWTISSFELPNSTGTYSVDFDVRGWTDGDNGKAELHLNKLTYPLDYVTTDWFD